MKEIVFKGVCTAMTTPFCDTGIDFVSMKKQIEYQLKNKVDALAFLGTTGEASTVTQEEYIEIAKFAKRQINGRAKFILGAGSNCTKTAVERCKLATCLGADALLVITPYYNKCTQNGLIKYYREISESTDLPIICYNVPSRTGVNIMPETMAEITLIKNVCGLKEACGNMGQICQTAKYIRDKIALYSGDDFLNYDMLSIGAMGCVSVLSNVLPNEVKKIFDDYYNGNYQKSYSEFIKNMPLSKALFCEVNPIPVKKAMEIIGLSKAMVREPLTELEYNDTLMIKNILSGYSFNC